MDVQATVEEALDAAAVDPAGESETAPPAASPDSPAAPSPAVATIDAKRAQRSYLPPALRRRLRACARWTHTPLALWLGSGATALLAAAVLGGVFLVGLRGVSAGKSYWYCYACVAQQDTSVDDALIFPRPQPDVGPPAIELPIPGTFAASLGAAQQISDEQLSQAVLQDYDLNGVFLLEGAAPVGNDPRNGLLAVYDADFQRGGSAIDQSLILPGLKAVFSDVAVYTDATTASNQMLSVDINQLGLNAGLPDMTATPLDLTQIGDESRAVRLIGTAGGDQVEVVLIQFRINGAVGVVGAAAALDDDPDIAAQAVTLAQTQQRNMLGLTLGQP